MKGHPGGYIETNEISTYPRGHCYAVQNNAWMDPAVWKIYAKDLLWYEIESPSVLLLDNFDSHVSDEGQKVIVEETCTAVCSFPTNATSTCQSRDVAIMGPLEKRFAAFGSVSESTIL